VPATVHAIRELREFLAERFPDARPLVERGRDEVARPVATGIGALDAVMPGAGFPRGKLSVWTPQGGAAAALRAACRAVATGGERAAWVDGSRTLTFGWIGAAAAPADHAHPTPRRHDAERSPWSLWSEDAPIVIHPADRTNALRCAEALLRCGAFGLVVLEGVESQGTETVRLTRAARDGGSAFVAITELAAMATLRISSRLDVHGVRWRRGPLGDPAAPVDVRVDVRVRALGWTSRATISLPIAAYDLRCAVGAGPDRRNAGASDAGEDG
jgi:hypothetical protein